MTSIRNHHASALTMFASTRGQPVRPSFHRLKASASCDQGCACKTGTGSRRCVVEHLGGVSRRSVPAYRQVTEQVAEGGWHDSVPADKSTATWHMSCMHMKRYWGTHARPGSHLVADTALEEDLVTVLHRKEAVAEGVWRHGPSM